MGTGAGAAPPGGSSLAFKALPLLLPLMGILKGRRYTYHGADAVLAYFSEGVVRAWSDKGCRPGWPAPNGAVVVSSRCDLLRQAQRAIRDRQ